MPNMTFIVYVTDYEDYDLEEEDDQDFDCHLILYRGVWLCGKAGSEECEFECPNNGLIGATARKPRKTVKKCKEVRRTRCLKRSRKGQPQNAGGTVTK